MQPPVNLPSPGAIELDAALLQGAITVALAALCGFLYRRYRKPWFAWWTVAWIIYLLRLGAIVTFVVTQHRAWLFWHQVATGWTALALLWAALVFSRRARWRPLYLAAILLPPLWAAVAIYRMQNFLLAAGPMVAFLSLATLATGYVFLEYRRRAGSSGSTLLAVTFLLWGLHHLDYPFLRARGAWAPWGYYLDSLFELAVGFGIALLVLDDLGRGLRALSMLSGDLQRGASGGHVLDLLLERPLTLSAVRGTALYLGSGTGGRFVQGAGACAAWGGTEPEGDAREAIARALHDGRPRVVTGTPPAGPGYAAALPVFRGTRLEGALVLTGDARDPFTALDDGFLLALGQQVGAALENAELYRRLEARSRELERLSARMVEQHEEERRRLSRELHDETAQVFSAVKMELGMLREGVGADAARRLDRAVTLVDAGIRSIRSVVKDLRPSLLDDLGLVPALRSLVAEFRERSGLEASFDAPDEPPTLSPDAELAVFRALQEALTNVVRHADASSVEAALEVTPGTVTLRVADDGRGPPAGGRLDELERAGHLGLAGMRERIAALGGGVRVRPGGTGGTVVEVEMPVAP